MIQIEYLPIVLTGIGIMASILYYASVLRNQNRTRRLQMIQNIWEWISSEEGYRRLGELLLMDWTDYEDFNRKYSVVNNPDNYAMRWAVWNKLNGLGYMVKEGAIDVETVYDHSGGRIIWLWIKFKPIVMEIRSEVAPYPLKWWEYLVDELMVEMKKRGDDLTVFPSDYRTE